MFLGQSYWLCVAFERGRQFFFIAELIHIFCPQEGIVIVR